MVNGEHMKTIDRDTYLKAQGLFHLSQRHYQKAAEFEKSLSQLLGYEDVYCGCISDELMDADHGTLDSGLKREKIEVENGNS
jgi:hypothetical protein